MALSLNGTTGVSGIDGSASAPALQGTDNNTGINFASDTVNINTGGSTRATVKSDGCLAIGTTTSAGLLHSAGTSYFGADANGKVYALSSGSEARIGAGGISSVTNIPLTFYTADGGSNNENMRIAANRNVLIHCTSSSGSSGRIYTNRGDANQTVLEVNQNNGSGSEMITFRASGSQLGTIHQSGSSGVSYQSNSDYRLKENDVVISDGITRLKQLRPIRFNWKADTSTVVDGFFAHEVSPVVPEAVRGNKDEVFDTDGVGTQVKGGPKYQQLEQSKLVPLLTAALQEAVAKIEVLETKVAALEAG